MNSPGSHLKYELECGSYFPVPDKSRLFLTAISRSMRITIFLFSVRAQPIVFRHQDPKATVGIIDCASSFRHIINRYATLTAPEDLEPIAQVPDLEQLEQLTQLPPDQPVQETDEP
ncbi:hypothetical protein CPB97_006370, partial [Podila verticillata]